VQGYTISTSGSVGFDGSLQMVATLPFPDNALGPVLKNAPKIREAAAKKQFQVTINGTLNKPALDARAFQQGVRQFLEEVTKDAAAGKVNDFLEKGLDKLLMPKKSP
jgi:translocation and assembly module TamB